MKKIILSILIFVSYGTYAQKNIQNTDSLLSVAQQQLANANDRSAFDIANKVLKQEPRNEKALYIAGVYWVNSGISYRALPYLDSLISINNRNAEYYWQRAKARSFETNNWERYLLAVADIDTAIAIAGPTNKLYEQKIALLQDASKKIEWSAERYIDQTEKNSFKDDYPLTMEHRKEMFDQALQYATISEKTASMMNEIKSGSGDFILLNIQDWIKELNAKKEKYLKTID